MPRNLDAELASARRRLAALEETAQVSDVERAEVNFLRTLVRELETRCTEARSARAALPPGEEQARVARALVLREEAKRRKRAKSPSGSVNVPEHKS